MEAIVVLTVVSSAAAEGSASALEGMGGSSPFCRGTTVRLGEGEKENSRV